MKLYVPVLFASSAFLLAACGGGGASGPGSGPPPTTPPTSTPSGTTAKGTLVDDPSGTPLAGVTVRLDPWATYPTPGPTPTPIATTTTDPSGHFTVSAKNGTYLLVIGSDSTSDTTRPTIHDKIVLNGQTTLAAPTMPPFPGVTPPPVETSGNYRLANIDQTLELPCILDYDSARGAMHLPYAIVDEWLTENSRSAIAQSQTSYKGQVSPSNPFGFLTSANVNITGGTDCSHLISPLPSPYATSESALWFAGSFMQYQGGAFSAFGIAQFPYDPRVYSDPNAVQWP